MPKKKVVRNMDDLTQAIRESVQDVVANQEYSIACTECGFEFKSKPGKCTCPKCKASFNFEIKTKSLF